MSDALHGRSLPAHHTKHLPTLTYTCNGHTFHLGQSDDGISNGTALWLGGQVLSAYTVDELKGSRVRARAGEQRRPRAVELGSGIGLTALVLCSLGYDVLATDTAHVCDSVLRRNIAANLQHLPSGAGTIQVRVLDWNIDSDRWQWDHPTRITLAENSSHQGGTTEHLLGPPFDLIISSDTLYDASLVDPFFRTVRALSAFSFPGQSLTPPLFLLALERRDPQLINNALSRAPVSLTRVPTKKLRKALERAGMLWDAVDWEGVEVWRGSLSTSPGRNPV
ncbi:hypothetical protein PAXRUDRAFT_823400 [Paxillus rubicundulus Ve08.2h10]|uniref:Uncharacterized protein n=1 Tax=Paxillus rubicundulus Ve08.2h10 TaxID=930991 RepID=A0A0D0EC69_9AGAM|nr:hypothetical protein PAXRUDRAFT_823400 [Paxillus rubicundulus Ve08.2h10]